MAADKPRSPGASGAAGAAAPGQHVTLEGKLVVAGDMNTGKTSLVAVFTTNELSPSTRPTVGVAYSKKAVQLPGLTCHLQLWDSCGQERFHAINQLFYRNAGAAILV